MDYNEYSLFWDILLMKRPNENENLFRNELHN